MLTIYIKSKPYPFHSLDELSQSIDDASTTAQSWSLDGSKMRCNTRLKNPALVFVVDGRRHRVPKKEMQFLKDCIQRAKDGDDVDFIVGIRVISSKIGKVERVEL